MAEFKFTAKYGSNHPGDIAISAGDAEAQSDTISINIDRTDMGRAEIIHLIDKIKDAILSAPFPPL